MTSWKIEFDNQFYSPAATKHPITVDAEYYQRSDDWVTFKDDANKVVYDAALRGIASIWRVQNTSGDESKRTVRVTLKANVDGYVADMDRAIEATKTLNKARKEGGE